MSARLSPEQRVLARKALGLVFEDIKVSRKNHYDAQLGVPTHDEWRAMAAAGFAVEGATGTYSTRFSLTRAGADAALGPGETLNPHDFPPIGAH